MLHPTFVASSGLAPTAPHLSYFGSWLGRRAEFPPSACCPRCFWCSTGYSFLSGLKDHIASLCPVLHPSVSQILFFKGCLKQLICSLCWYWGLSWSGYRTLHLALLHFLRFVVDPLVFLTPLFRMIAFIPRLFGMLVRYFSESDTSESSSRSDSRADSPWPLGVASFMWHHKKCHHWVIRNNGLLEDFKLLF